MQGSKAGRDISLDRKLVKDHRFTQ
jgi:hypothetical protein